MASSDVEHWQCDKTLPQCMTYMLDNEIMCDITFLLGEERFEVHAHKYMLASRSPVFHAMLDGPMAERGKIEIPDIEKGIFDVFLRYVYTDNVSVTVDNVLKVMYASKKYCVDLLTKQCKDFVKKNITNESACVLMDSALMLQEEEIYKSCLEEIKENTESCIRSPGFTTVSKETLKSITELADVTVQEEVLYEQVMKWCDAECGRQELEVTWENKRTVLGEILYYIRFPLMDPKYFAEKCGETELLTDKEKVEIMYFHSVNKSTSRQRFRYKERFKRKLERVIRLSHDPSNKWNLIGRVDAIAFSTSHDSEFHGILVYGTALVPCTYTVEIRLRDSNSCILATYKASIESNKSIEMHELKLKETVNIKANDTYHVELVMTGSQSKAGKMGITTVDFGNGKKSITFVNSVSSKNGTDVTMGQLPGLLLK